MPFCSLCTFSIWTWNCAFLESSLAWSSFSLAFSSLLRKKVPQSAETRPETSRCLWWSRMRLRHESSVWRGHDVHERRGWTMVRWAFVTLDGSQYGDDNLCVVLLLSIQYTTCLRNRTIRRHRLHLDRTVPLRKWQRSQETDLVAPRCRVETGN